MGKYRTIVADPPWPYTDGPTARQRAAGLTFLPYRTISLDEIKALPVASLAAPAAHVYAWTTNRFLWEMPAVAETWGLRILQTLVWCKDPMGLGPGSAFANTVEFLVFGRMRLGRLMRDARLAAGLSKRDVSAAFPSRNGLLTGCVTNWESDLNLPTTDQWERLRSMLPGLSGLGDLVPEPVRQPSSWFRWPRGAHSQKPEAFIDLVEQVSPGPYVELFARRHRLGWDVWGDESANTADWAVS